MDEQKARELMECRFQEGQPQEAELIEQVLQTVIVDRLVPPGRMSFYGQGSSAAAPLYLRYQGDPVEYTVHRHALNQLCQKVSLPIAYASALLQAQETWKHILLADSLDALFTCPEWLDRSGAPTRFLHRVVGTELRGFLSRRFNRHLASAPLLRAFTEQCRLSGARPIEAVRSPVRNALKCLLPALLEVFPGEYLCLGVEWSNSDFGSGRLKVLQTVWRVGAGTGFVVDEGLRRAHIGSVIEDSDVEMSDETAKKEVEAQQGAVRDHVQAFLAQEAVDRLLQAIRIARDAALPWSTLVSRLQGVVGKENLDWMREVLEGKATIVDLPPISFLPDGQASANAYWAASALSLLASRAQDPERRLELQREAGKFLAPALIV